MHHLPRRPFGTTGLSVAPLGIGSIPPDRGVDVVVRQMNALLDAGANLVDTAQCYGESERIIGRHLHHRRHEMVLVSKCGHHEVLPDGRLRSRSVHMEDVDQALRRLRTDHLDAMLLHSYDYDLLVRGEALEVLDRARQEGKIRHVGYSGDNERLDWAVGCPLIDVVEASVSLADQANLRRAVPRARDRGVAVIAKRPLANAAWTHAGNPDAAPEGHAHYARRFARMALDPAALGCDSMAELALRFTLSMDGVSCAIVSSASPAHLAANLEATRRGPLPAPSAEAIRQRFDACERESAGTWLACN